MDSLLNSYSYCFETSLPACMQTRTTHSQHTRFAGGLQCKWMAPKKVLMLAINRFCMHACMFLALARPPPPKLHLRADMLLELTRGCCRAGQMYIQFASRKLLFSVPSDCLTHCIRELLHSHCSPNACHMTRLMHRFENNAARLPTRPVRPLTVVYKALLRR